MTPDRLSTAAPLQQLSAQELCEALNLYLWAFEQNPSINQTEGGARRFFNAGARVIGQHIQITYISFQGAHLLTKEQAVGYLSQLQAGQVGEHQTLSGGSES